MNRDTRLSVKESSQHYGRCTRKKSLHLTFFPVCSYGSGVSLRHYVVKMLVPSLPLTCLMEIMAWAILRVLHDLKMIQKMWKASGGLSPLSFYNPLKYVLPPMYIPLMLDFNRSVPHRRPKSAALWHVPSRVFTLHCSFKVHLSRMACFVFQSGLFFARCKSMGWTCQQTSSFGFRVPNLPSKVV